MCPGQLINGTHTLPESISAHTHTRFLSHTLTQRHGHTERGWHTENLTKQRSLWIITGSETKREMYKGRKMVSKDVKVIDVSLDTDVCLPTPKIILLSFKRHKITGWEIIVHKRTLDTCGHDQNTWLKKMKAFNSQLRPLETARWVQTQHGIDTEGKKTKKQQKGGEANVRKIIVALKHLSSIDVYGPPPKHSSSWQTGDTVKGWGGRGEGKA